MLIYNQFHTSLVKIMIEKLYSWISKNRSLIMMLFALILILLAIYGLYYVNDKYILPRIDADKFIINWMTNRNFIKEGTSPYGDMATLRIHLYLYGHPATGNESPVRYAYPLTSLLLFWPFALISDPEKAKAFWLIFQELLLLLIIVFSIRIGIQKRNWSQVIFVLPIIVGFVFILRSLFMGGFMILSVLSILLWLYFVIKKSDEVAGLFLAISGIDLVVILPILIGTILWSIYNRQWKHLIWFGLVSAISGALVALIMPNWIIEFFQSFFVGLNLPPYISMAELLKRGAPAVAVPLAYVISAVAIVIFMVEMVSMRKFEQGFTWLMLLLFSISPLLGFPVNVDGMLIFYPLFIISLLIWSSRGKWALAFVALAQLIVVGWPWLGIAPWQLGDYFAPQLDKWMLVLPFISVFILYWIRWWVVKPAHGLSDRLMEQ
jgi:hypothetical protein